MLIDRIELDPTLPTDAEEWLINRLTQAIDKLAGLKRSLQAEPPVSLPDPPVTRRRRHS